ncbi:MAG: hypothetical protein EAZ97_10605 [Bacteroidetes bacterium]|nr:MAG: hypothetical protein EAZ97_10605 [Bacteroidota bacterium]
MKTKNRNNSIKAQNDQELEFLRTEKWNLYISSPVLEHLIKGKQIKLRSGSTFTPFANAVPCNAHCAFCSEDLVRKGEHLPTAQTLIKDYKRYFEGLKAILNEFKGLKMGLSLSGLEATAEPKWLSELLEILTNTDFDSIFDEKVLYTNGTGLVNFPELILQIQKAGFERIELSRCHDDEKINQQIMYFNKNQAVRKNEVFKSLFDNEYLKNHIKISCILTKKGINSLEKLENYLEWVDSLGVKTVVFREMSRMDQQYDSTVTYTWIEENRVEIEQLMKEIAPTYSNIRKNWTYQKSTIGYYYYNEHYFWKNKIEVIIETSSYSALMQANASGIVQKLIYHSNGNLTGDWDSNNAVIANFYEK